MNVDPWAWSPLAQAGCGSGVCSQSWGLGLLCSAVLGARGIGHGDQELPVDEAVPSVQAALVDKTDAFLEVPLAGRKNKPDRLGTSEVEQDFPAAGSAAPSL